MKHPHARLSRRNFLFAATAGTAATAAAVVAKNQAQPEKKKEQESAKGAGYQFTEHVRNYYRTAKI